MAFPTVAAKGTTYSTGGTATITHVVDLPDGLAAGDRVIICAGLRDNSAFTWPSSPAWSSIAAVAAPTSGGRLECRYHDVDGTEGWTDGSTITITTAGSVKGVAFAWRVTGHDPGTAPEAVTATGAATANPDPASLDPAGWASEDTLWIVACYSNANNTTSVYPTDFADDQENAVATGASAASARICSRSVNASSQDPSAFTISGAQNCALVTMAVRPAAAEPVTGTVDVTLPALAVDAAGTVTVAGTATVDLPALQADVAGTVEVAGDAAVVLPALDVSLAGVVAVEGQVDATLPALTVDTAGVVTVAGVVDATLPALDVSLAGLVGDAVSGTVDLVLPALAAEAAVSVTVAGTVAAQLPALDVAVSGSVEVSGVVDVTLPALLVQLTGESDTEVEPPNRFRLRAIPDRRDLVAVPGRLTLVALED